MELGKQAVSLELAKQLRKLGVKQASLFYWNRLSDTPDGREDWHIHNIPYRNSLEFYSAFTVGELGEMLPWFDKENNELRISRYSGDKHKWQICYYNSEGNVFEGNGKRIPSGFVATAATEADARARMLIWLIENNYLNSQA